MRTPNDTLFSFTLIVLLTGLMSCSQQTDDSQKSNSNVQQKQSAAQGKSKYDDPPLISTFGSGTSEGTTESVGNISGSATGGVPFALDPQKKPLDPKSPRAKLQSP